MTVSRAFQIRGMLCMLAALAGCNGGSAPSADSFVVTSTTGGFSAAGGTQSFGSGGVQGFVGTGGTPIASGTGGEAVVSGTGGAGAVTTSMSDLPCDVQQVLKTNCWKCHDDPPNWGGPMSLVTQADFLAMGKVTTASVVRDLVKTRINDTSKPMPPITEPVMTADDLAVLNQWLDAGTPQGDGSACVTENAGGDMGGTGGTEAVDPNDPYAGVEPWDTEPGWPGGVAPQETCYQFLKHGAQSPTDTTPMVTPNGEFYVTFYYKAPWTEPVVATRWRTVYDQTQILHHWLLYESTAAASKDGTYDQPLAASNLLAGAHTTAGNLVAGWAVGGGAEIFPKGVGMKMQPPGGMFELEWHLFNSTGGDVADRSGIEICVVPESAVDPKYIASMTWLGSEQLVIPPGKTTKCSGTCNPSFKGGGPATIITWVPHMHLIGVHMDTWVNHPDGSQDHIFDEPFQFDFQISHRQNPPYVVNQGDTLLTTCTFNNTTSNQVLFGQSTTMEMCYQFVVAYPVDSLTGVAGTEKVLTGAFNGCGLTAVPANPCQ